MTATELIVPGRFCGPPSSGNGGWTSGALAALVDPAHGDRATAWPPINVSLRQPPPLDTPMPVGTGDDGATVASYGDSAVARAHLVDPGAEQPRPVAPVDPATARAAESGYPGLRSHPFPTCFACGTEREEGDGLRIWPGPVEGATRVAATWTPHASVAEDWHTYVDDAPHASLAVTWAALDCVGGWAGDLTERLMVLASMTARVDALPVIGEEHVVVGERRGGEGRKTWTASSLYDGDGRLVALAEHLWVAIDPQKFSAVTK